MQLDDARAAEAFGVAAQEMTWPVAVADRGSHAEGYPPTGAAMRCRMEGGYTLHIKGLCIYALRSRHMGISRSEESRSFISKSQLRTALLLEPKQPNRLRSNRSTRTYSQAGPVSIYHLNRRLSRGFVTSPNPTPFTI